MKTLGGVGAVVMGAMLLLTVKVGPASSQPVPSSSTKNDPLAAVAAVPEAPPRRTPAAAPVPVSDATVARRLVVIVPAAEAGSDEGTRPKRRHQVELPQAFDCSFELELPVGFSAL